MTAIDQTGTYQPRLNADAFAHLPKDRRDWLEVFGNQWAGQKIRPGTCMACVYNRGEHAEGCVKVAEFKAKYAAAAAEDQ